MTNKQINQVIKEMRIWSKAYHDKFKDGNTFWDMFFRELRSKLIEHCTHREDTYTDDKDRTDTDVEVIEINSFDDLIWFFNKMIR